MFTLVQLHSLVRCILTLAMRLILGILAHQLTALLQANSLYLAASDSDSSVAERISPRVLGINPHPHPRALHSGSSLDNNTCVYLQRI